MKGFSNCMLPLAVLVVVMALNCVESRPFLPGMEGIPILGPQVQKFMKKGTAVQQMVSDNADDAILRAASAVDPKVKEVVNTVSSATEAKKKKKKPTKATTTEGSEAAEEE